MNVTYTKINTSQSATVSMQATDIAGNVAIVDPWDIAVTRETGTPDVITDICSPVLDKFTPYGCGRGVGIGQPLKHSDMEHNVTVINGSPGLKNPRIIVNGIAFQVAGLKDGEVSHLNIASAMKNNANSFSVEALGKPGGTANVSFWGSDVPAKKR